MTPTTEPIKANWREIAMASREDRSVARLSAHYEIERELVERFARADRAERSALYATVYDELYARLPDHPQHRVDQNRFLEASAGAAFLKRLIPHGARFAEIGAGDCLESIALADHCRSVIALDVSGGQQIAGARPDNFRFAKIDGISIPLKSQSVDFFYSNQLLEHLHPSDAFEQLQAVCRILAPGGVYYCATASALCGPHDISRYFDDRPTGLHFREYTYQDLERLFCEAGFGRLRAVWRKGAHHLTAPVSVAVAMERAYSALPSNLRAKFALMRPIRNALGLRMLAYKSASFS